MKCASCKVHACRGGNSQNTPEFCPMNNDQDLILENISLYEEKENNLLAINAARTEAQGYCQWTRLEEIINFSSKCSYQKLGLAFCIGLNKEATVVAQILKKKGFEVLSVACKTGGIAKEELGLTDEEKVRVGSRENICNPIVQAKLLNKENTDFNILLGLCVGHDSLFIKYAKAPITVLAVKDRVLAHNPLACIYSQYHLKNRF